MPAPIIPVFNFTRNPSTKASVSIETTGIVPADYELIIVGRRAASGGSATNSVPALISNYGDPVAVVAEAAALFGTASEIGGMIVAAITAVQNSDLANKRFPKIKAICLANAAASSTLAALLNANIAIPMPFIAQPYAPTDATALAALNTFLTTINGDDRGANGQFGSFAVMGCKDTLSNTVTAGQAAGSQNIMVPWLRDTGSANTEANIAAAYAAICASLGVPFLPLNDVIVGGLVPPVAAADYATTGDSGTISAGLDAGVVPLYIDQSGNVKISRSITSYRPGGSEASEYFDFQDWKVLYYFRENAYALSQQPRYKIAKATDAKLKSLKSELIIIAQQFQELEMFQYVEKLIQYWTVTRVTGNRSAAVYGIPVNVVPGFMNKGLGLVGTDLFDSFVIG